MKKIGSLLLEQVLYKKINELTKPLLPEYVFIEKRNHSKYTNIDYQVSNCL